MRGRCEGWHDKRLNEPKLNMSPFTLTSSLSLSLYSPIRRWMIPWRDEATVPQGSLISRWISLLQLLLYKIIATDNESGTMPTSTLDTDCERRKQLFKIWCIHLKRRKGRHGAYLKYWHSYRAGTFDCGWNEASLSGSEEAPIKRRSMNSVRYRHGKTTVESNMATTLCINEAQISNGCHCGWSFIEWTQKLCN